VSLRLMYSYSIAQRRSSRVEETAYNALFVRPLPRIVGAKWSQTLGLHCLDSFLSGELRRVQRR
jgi:hypothetical protein